MPPISTNIQPTIMPMIIITSMDSWIMLWSYLCSSILDWTCGSKSSKYILFIWTIYVFITNLLLLLLLVPTVLIVTRLLFSKLLFVSRCRFESCSLPFKLGSAREYPTHNGKRSQFIRRVKWYNHQPYACKRYVYVSINERYRASRNEKTAT